MRPIIRPLTSVRFFAALLVIIFHYDKKLLLFPAGVADFGYQSVAFFFILSGFVLTYTHATSDGLNVSNGTFAVSRFARIYPSYALALLVSAPFMIRSISWNYTLVPLMLQSWWAPSALLWNDPAWSISNEIVFYALFPIVWFCLSQLGDRFAMAVSASLLVFAYVPRKILGADATLYAYFPLLNIPQFILGVALANLFLRYGPLRLSNALFLTSVASMVAIIAVKPTIPEIDNNLLLCGVFGLAIYFLGGTSGSIKATLSHRWPFALGDASYAMYILHVPIWLWWDRIFRVTLQWNIPPTIDFLLYLGATIAISLLVTRFFEKPSRRILIDLFQRSQLRPVLGAKPN